MKLTNDRLQRLDIFAENLVAVLLEAQATKLGSLHPERLSLTGIAINRLQDFLETELSFAQTEALLSLMKNKLERNNK